LNLTDLIHKRINKYNKNWLAVIVGETGSGKSYSAMKLAELLDPTFNISRVVFTPKGFIKLLNKGKLRKGNIIIFDECGVGLSSRNWYNTINKVIGYILQTFRHRNLGVIFTSPDISFVDVQARKLFHTYFETLKIDYEKGLVATKVFRIQTNPRFNKSYFKRYRLESKGGKYALKTLYISMPSKELIRSYEAKKRRYTKKLGQKVEEEVDKLDEKPKPQLTDQHYVKLVKKKLKGKKITIPLIQSLTGLSYKKAQVIRATINRETPLSK
jgi:ABC-type oligopeptide transport system ATPase subunit